MRKAEKLVRTYSFGFGTFGIQDKAVAETTIVLYLLDAIGIRFN